MKNYTKDELYKLGAIKLYKMVLKGDKIKKFPKGFWEQPEAKENAIKCIKYLMEDILKYDDEMIKENNSKGLYKEYKLSGMLKQCFSNSPYKAIETTYPNKFKEWEFKNIPKSYWKDRGNGIKATKWLIEEKLKLDDYELKEQLSTALFVNNNLNGMLQHCFNNSPYEAINSTYPNKYKEWEFKFVPQGYWNNKENGIKATKWLIEDKLKLSDEEIKEQVWRKLFKDNGLYGMLQHCFNNSPYEAINSTYPNKFKKSDFLSYQKNNKM